MKKINYLYAVLFLVFASLISEGFGWKNANQYANTEYSMKFGGDHYNDHLYSWQLYLYDYDYSSHDWIADEALSMVLTSLYFDDWEDSQGNPFWDVEGIRRQIFLYATAGPDIGPRISIKSKSGVTVSESCTVRSHHYYFDGARNPSDRHLATYALSAAGKAVKAIKKGDCNVGAFWLGVMTHYIADACLFLHVDPNNRDDQFENWISSRMDSCQGISERSAGNPYSPLHQYEFLQFTTSSLLVFSSPPDMCVRRVAYDTRFDSNFGSQDGTYTASWMLSAWQSFSGTEVRTKARTRADWLGWATAGEGTLQQDGYKFFQRLEDSVNLGVWETANAMQWVIEQVGTYKCSQGVEDLKQAVVKQASLSMFFSLFSLLGLTLIDYVMRSSEIWVVGLVLH